MSSNRPPEVDRAYDHLDEVETQVPASVPHTHERLEALRASVEEYETTEAESDQRDLLDRIEGEIDELRESIEQEVEQGEEKANDALAEVEQRVSDLRDRLHS